MSQLENDKVQAQSPTSDEIAAQVKAVLSSSFFRSSDSSRRLLSFLADWSSANPGKKMKEAELAIAVYNRTRSNFDPQIDSVARVQVGRLRSKLLEYYAVVGSHDEVILEIPKGTYYLAAHYRPEPMAEVPPPPPPAETKVATEVVSNVSLDRAPPRAERSTWALAALVSGLMIGAATTLLVVKATQPSLPSPVLQFWRSFTAPTQRTIVVFSNPRLSGTLAYDGLRYFTEQDARAPGNENLTYTGAGDVRSVHTLTDLFNLFRQPLDVQSGALLSWDEAKNANEIFLGRPEQNPALHELPRLDEFYFTYAVGIVNAHPAAGEQAHYQSSGRPYSYDYAVIGFIPGVRSPFNTLVLGGTTTYGSQAAVEFMAQEQTVSSLFERLRLKPGGRVPYFEALLRVHISHEIPIRSEIVAVRPHQAAGRSWEPAKQNER